MSQHKVEYDKSKHDSKHARGAPAGLSNNDAAAPEHSDPASEKSKPPKVYEESTGLEYSAFVVEPHYGQPEPLPPFYHRAEIHLRDCSTFFNKYTGIIGKIGRYQEETIQQKVWFCKFNSVGDFGFRLACVFTAPFASLTIAIDALLITIALAGRAIWDLGYGVIYNDRMAISNSEQDTKTMGYALGLLALNVFKMVSSSLLILLDIVGSVFTTLRGAGAGVTEQPPEPKHTNPAIFSSSG